MNLPFKFARRYLFAKKSTNAINIITSISVLGVAIGTAALILVLSVFNGFEDLITGLFSNFNPDVKITPAKGKSFRPDTLVLKSLEDLEGVAYVSQTLEEVAFFEYKSSQDFGILKGVDDQFHLVTNIDSMVREGAYAFKKNGRDLAVMGVGMRNKLLANVDDLFSTISVYMPKRKRVGPLQKPFREKLIYPGGTFVIQQDFDNQYILTSIEFARSILGTQDPLASALEVRLAPEADVSTTLQQIRSIVGANFVVKDRYEQDEAFLKLMNIEKWMSYAILSLTLLLVAFNMIGSLWMIVLEKKNDIAILKSMGATRQMVRNIFLMEGVFLCTFGMVIGFAVALGLYFLHVNLENGLISIPQGFLVTAYPVSIRGIDFIVIAATVIVIGLIASILPALRAQRVPPIILEE
jgi:lipoprotein-releasing system permease protein